MQSFKLIPIVLLFLSVNIVLGQDDTDHSDLIAFAMSAPCKPIYDCPRNIKVMNPDTGISYILETGIVGPELIFVLPEKRWISYYQTHDAKFHVLGMVSLDEVFSLQLSQSLYFSYEWSPDANWVAISNRDDRSGVSNLSLLDTKTWELTQVTKNLEVRLDMAFSPDESELLFFATEEGEYGTEDIYLLDLATLEYRNLTQNPGNNFSPSWSSDGQQIVFTSGEEIPDHLTIMEDGALRKTLDTGPSWVGRPEWVLNDKYLLFFAEANDVGTLLYMIEVETGDITQLTDRPLSGYDVSTDGERVVYQTTIAADNNLCVIELRTQESRCFPDETPYSIGSPSWSH